MNPSHKTLREALRWGEAQLPTADAQQGRRESQRLLMEAGGFTRAALILKEDEPLPLAVLERFEIGIKQRAAHRPLQYILGEWEFMGLPFFVGEGVLIPRGDTEILVETVLAVAAKESLPRMVDIGCGSGCIAISLAHYGGIEMIGLDISLKALAFAEKNGQRNQVSVKWLESDLFSALPKAYFGALDAIVSNPPYIPRQVVATLEEEVRLFEPENALDGGIDGLDFYRRIIKESVLWLRDGGYLFFEIGYDQGQAVRLLMEEAGFFSCRVNQDLAGLDRVVFGQWRG